MDGWQLIAGVLWTGFAFSLVAAAAAPFALSRAGRGYALALLGVATLYLLFFSFLTGFSIGRFVEVIPLVLTAFAVSLDRKVLFRVEALAGALLVYLVFSWLAIPFYFAIAGTPLIWVFSFDAIPLYGLAAIAAFTWSALNPPRTVRATGSELPA